MFIAAWITWTTSLLTTLLGIVRLALRRPWSPTALAVSTFVAGVGVIDVAQTRHSIRRNYPVLARARWIAEAMRPELRQYFVESDTDGRPFDRNERTFVYEQAKDVHSEQPFGTELDVMAEGYEWFTHSMRPRDAAADVPRIRIGGPDCTQPYDMSMLNVSAMSFGALSGPAITALNVGARDGGFAHDTGEGGISPYHRQGGDLVMEIGTAYFGVRTADGRFDPALFTSQAADPQVKLVSIKLSQGAKPGLGGVMPAAKVTQEIADIRKVPVGEKCVSPGYHTTFDSPVGLLHWLNELRDMSGGKPTGFKLCVGRRVELLAVVKAMQETGITPDFIIVDGSEGGTGAAPLTFEDRGGMPLDIGLPMVHNALVGAGLRDRVRIGCSGKIVTGFDIAKRLAQGADYVNAARTMMFAIGCIQAQRCQTNTCPVGVTTQDPKLTRGLVIPDKSARVTAYQRNVVDELSAIVGAMGLEHPSQITGDHLYRRTGAQATATYTQLFGTITAGSLTDGTAPPHWMQDWNAADPATFTPTPRSEV